MIKFKFFAVFLTAFCISSYADNKPADLPYVGTSPTAPEPTGIKITNKIDAKSCNFDDVNAATSKAEPGTQVNIPAGNCDWGLHSLTAGAGIYIKGAGKNQTIIVRTTPAEPNNPEKKGPGNFLITFNCAPDKPNALSNLTLQGNGRGSERQNGNDQRDNGLMLNGWKYINGVKSSSACDNFRVFNAKFSGFGSSAITVAGNPALTSGIIFNSDFTHNYFFHPKYQATILGYGVAVYGDGSWPSLTLGTADNIFIENNYMLGNRHHVASNNSSRYVFRYNTAITTDSTKNDFALDAHGRGVNNGSSTGSRQYEIYANAINTNFSSPDIARTAIGIRGGDGMIFNNDIGPQFRYGIELMVEGEANTGADCRDTAFIPDKIADLSIWGNRNAAKTPIFSGCPRIVESGREYFLQAKKGYVPFAYPHPLRQ